jgi:hypothetical protein
VAICDHEKRPGFLDCMRFHSCIWPGDKKRLVGSEEMLWLSSRNIKIRHLNCRALTDNTAVIIADFGIHLKWLKIDEPYVNDICLVRIAECCPNLKSLNLSSCNDLTDISVIRLAECCPHLEILDMAWCRNVTDKRVIRIAEGCPNMKDLNLRNCSSISDASIVKIVECCHDIEILHI